MHELIHRIRRIVVRPNSSGLFEINILLRLLISSTKYTAQIDTVGWIFIAFAVVITAIAAILAYHGSETMIANSPVSHVAGSPG
jgi:hypothetical protein